MRKIMIALSGAAAMVPAAALAQAVWVPGSEIVNQSAQVQTNGVVNTVHFAPGGVAHITTPAGNTVTGSWTATAGQLCLMTGGAQECWPYAAPFQAGQPITLTSSCAGTSTWTALGTNQPPVQSGAGERG